MTRNSFLVLAGATALSVLAAAATLVLDRGAPALAEAGERLFPGLETSAPDIARLTFREDDFEAVVERRDGAYVDAASGYPVDTEVLQEIVGALTLAEIAEAKTSDPERHADLGLAAPDAEEGGGSEVILEDGEGKTLAHVIAGKRDYTLGGITGGQYLRRGGEDATWLARARIDPPARRAGWFDTRLFTTEASTIASATLTPVGAEPIAFTRDGEDFTLDAVLDEGKSPQQTRVDRIPRLFATLDFDDVRPTGDAELTGASLAAETEDGVTITLLALEADEEDDSTWVRIAVEGSGEEADALRDRADGFEFALPSVDAQVLGWTLDDLVETPES